MQALAVSAQGGWTAQASATVVAAALVFGGAAIGVGQKWRTDRREHWWLRTQWAIEQLGKGEESRTIALEVLRSQGQSKLASADDQILLDGIATVVLERLRRSSERNPYQALAHRGGQAQAGHRQAPKGPVSELDS